MLSVARKTAEILQPSGEWLALAIVPLFEYADRHMIISSLDTHCHVQFPQFDTDRPEVLARAREAGIGMVAIGTDVATSRLACELAQGTGDIWATVGLHPNDNLDEVFNIDEYRALALRERVVAIGEIGLDYFRTTDVSAIAIQRKRFEEQLQLASELALPVVLHCRDSAKQAIETSRAHEDMISILRSHKMHKGIVHSFTGTAQHAKAYIEEGFFVGLNGIITFVPEYHEMVRSLPFERIVTETDAPYLAPGPKRGKKNEPLYMLHTIETLSKLHNMSVEQAKTMLFENAKSVLSIQI